MRSSLTRNARNLAGALGRDTPARGNPTSRPQFTCADSHSRAAATTTTTSTQPSSTARTFGHTPTLLLLRRRRRRSPSSRTIHTGGPRSPPPPTPPPPPQQQTHYDLFPQTFPQGPPPHAPFTPDLRRLRAEFLQLQAQSHPDLAPASRKRQAEAQSMRINEAYRTLQDPLKRAQYLLAQQGIDVEDEAAKLDEADAALLMEVMEAREAVDEVADEEGLGRIREENDRRVGESVRVLEGAFRDRAWDTAKREAIRLRYWMNIEESIRGWEKGKGGGVVHH